MEMPIIASWAKDRIVLYRSRVEALAHDKRPQRAPFVSIPLSPSYRGDERICVVVNREHLKAAMSAHGVRRVDYDLNQGQLVVSGPKTRYALKDVLTGNRNTLPYARRGARSVLEDWAKAQRERKVSKAMSVGDRRAAKIQRDIEVAQRKLAKIHESRPVNPLCVDRRQNGGIYFRDSEARWAKGKGIRKALAKLTGKWIRRNSRPDSWKEFYEQVARILSISEVFPPVKHDRVCNRKGGPEVVGYLKHLPKHIAGQSKPWRSLNWDDKFDGARMQKSRLEYLEEMQAKRIVEDQIKNLEELKRAAKGEECQVHQ